MRVLCGWKWRHCPIIRKAKVRCVKADYQFYLRTEVDFKLVMLLRHRFQQKFPNSHNKKNKEILIFYLTLIETFCILIYRGLEK